MIVHANNRLFPIEIKSSIKVEPHNAQRIAQFRQRYQSYGVIGQGLVIYTGPQIIVFDEQTAAVPWWVL